jgi:beta-lactamase regulating signal transducer with metallopeptidase domain
MIASIFSMDAYFLFNGAIAVGYLISQGILSLSCYNKNILQVARLKFARYSLCAVVGIFFIVPALLEIFPSISHSSFKLEPLLKNTSDSISETSHIIHKQIIPVSVTESSITIHSLWMLAFLSGVCFFLIKYIRSLYQLKKLSKLAYCQHHIHHVHVLYSETTVPFCWSFFKKHFIVIPQLFLEKRDDLKLAVRHELQHIRQGDTYWLHAMSIIKVCCFWNPFVKLWINLLDELQEFSCDEALVLRKKSSPIVYAQCLINSASDVLNGNHLPQGVLGIRGLSQSVLYRRVNMLVNYKKIMKKSSLITAYIVAFLAAGSIAYALNGSSAIIPLTPKEVDALIVKADLQKTFHVVATNEVISELNNIIGSDKARLTMRESLQRMEKYKPLIKESLKKQGLPEDLLVVPLIESGYRPLEERKNPVLAAGLWQIIPETGKRLGLNVKADQDERMDTALSTKAALTYLKSNYNQFHDWRLAVIAYEIGQQQTDSLIKKTGSRDAWILARSTDAPSSLKDFSARLDAELIIMHYPSLVEARAL